MVELADTSDLGSDDASRGGSSPFARTRHWFQHFMTEKKMKVTEQKAEGLKKKYQVVIENRDFEAKVEKKLNEVAKNVKLPGFRPGKAPKEMLKQK